MEDVVFLIKRENYMVYRCNALNGSRCTV